MKKIATLLMLVLLTSQINVNVFAGIPAANDLLLAPEAGNVEVLYFHYSRRCATCEAVENETQIALKEYFDDMMKDGSITFLSVDIEDETNQSLIDANEISGQTLVFVSGDKKVDLTNDAFMNARTKPEKFRKKVKKTIDGLIK